LQREQLGLQVVECLSVVTTGLRMQGALGRASTLCALWCRDAALLEAFISIGLPVAGLPRDVCSMLLRHSRRRPRLVTPAVVRGHLATGRGAAADAAVAARLLRYCMSDIDDGDASSVAQLAGLPLVPLVDGTLGALRHLPDGAQRVLGDQGREAVMFVGDAWERALLAGLPHLVVDCDALGSELSER
jgi:hypothetical protein